MSLLRLQLAPLDLRLIRPVQTGAGEIAACRALRVQVEGEGHVGWGEATGIPGRGDESSERSAAALGVCRWGVPAPEEVSEIDAIVARIPAGAPAARYGLELALLDWLGRRKGVPVSQLLTASPRSEVPVNALLPADTEAELASLAEAAVRDGFRTLKIKVGAQALAEDLARVRAVRRAVGAAARIRVDANGGWTEAVAERALDALGALDVELCEQPVAAGDSGALARLARSSLCRVAADESVPALIRDGGASSVRLWVLKPAALGGLLPCLRAMQQARQAGIESYVTASWEGRIGRTGALHLAAAMPSADWAHGLATGQWMLPDEEAAPLPVSGRMEIGTAPGLGLEVQT